MASLEVLGQGSDNYSVPIDIEVDAQAPSIKLHFLFASDANSYDVFRKDAGTSDWSNSIGQVTSGDGYTDNTVEAGKTYDYFVRKNGKNGLVGQGYVTTGIGVAAIHNRGSVLLLIDSAIHEGATQELNTLRWDLTGDGYHVVEEVVSPNQSHQDVKKLIEDTKAVVTDLNSIYILGHVAVPYSGIYCEDQVWTVPPDGHKEGVGDHCGAWPADAYYGVSTGSWTDVYTVTDGTRPFTKNEPGDGKFDQIILPGKVEFALGRVDLSDLPKFSKTELELTKQYLNKAHAYRHGISKPVMRALVDENFGANSNEQFGGSGYRSFGAVVGIENVNMNDYMTTLKDSQYIVAYGTGPGSFTSAGGIGNTDDFVNNQGAAYFNMLFGSFFGNWNVTNNFLRAPLAVEHGGLTNAWAGRPNWNFAPMAFNQTAGYCAMISQNNKNEYRPGYFANQIHVALMGDPTLRLHMFQPPENVTVTAKKANEEVEIAWTAPSNTTLDGYNVYYSRDSLGPYTQANTALITATSFTHASPYNGKVYYMVRGQRLENSKSGSFENLSHGSFGNVDNLINTSIDPRLTQVEALQIFPNPAAGSFYVEFTSDYGKDVQLEVMDMKGSIVLQTVLRNNGPGRHQIDLTGNVPGLYHVRVNNATKRLVLR
ncbi:MAG: T9SS type A sorting domain-containing protein [Bacteroidia bacterium]|nr:T9SS type A sorting domain-containing protein [Bacteroidia bacterium]